MSLDGLRAWVAEVERKLGMRTRVFLALAALAIGVGGAATYLAIDTRQGAVSEADVQELQRELEAQIGTGGGVAGGTELPQLEAELKALQAQVERLSGKGRSGQGNQRNQGSQERGDEGATGGAGAEGTGSAGAGADSDRLQELLERAKEGDGESE